jgi:hypothetical protein
MKTKKMKILNFIFCLAFVGMIFVPFCMLDTTEVIDSTLENRRMTMWPGWGFSRELNEWYGHYVEDRVGFREEAVQTYMTVVHSVFGEFSDDMHMYGKNGEVFPADRDYIRAYQNLATDEELIDDFVTYLDRTDEYLEKQGIPFFFLAGLDKKTVYGEYMPDYIHVDESKESIMEMLARKLDDAGVAYVIPVKEYQEMKKYKQLYNTKYDTAHWNAHGAFYALQILNAMIMEENPEVPLLDTGDYNVTVEEVAMEFVSLPITERVYVFTPSKYYQESTIQDYELSFKLEHMEGTSVQHFINENAQSDQTILILQDSFLQDNAHFFTTRYREVYMISRQNYERMQYYVETLEPDVVVFENAERAFVDDLYAYVNLANVTYD